jgi:signal transduction histidine kinase/CheY-like chemotaxis protein
VAVAIAVGGFFLLRRMVGQIARLAQDLRGAPGESGLPSPGAVRPTSVPGFGEVSEIGQVADGLRHMLGDLRGATQRLEDLVFKLGTLNEMVEIAARIPRIQDLLGIVLDSTMRAVHATIGSIMILDKDGQTLRLAASRGIPDEVIDQVGVKVGEGIAGKVVQLGQAVLVDDIATDPRFQRPSGPQYANGSFICMPIRVADRVIGVVNMAKKTTGPDALRPAPFSPVDLQFLNALMTYVGYAVDNARLLEEAQTSASRLQGVVDDLKTTQAAYVRAETLRAIGQLSSGVAHHLNNLFAVILGRVELLLRRVEDGEIRRALEIVLRTAQDGAEVVRRVQRFSRVQPVAAPAAVDLNDLATEVVELTRPRWYDEAQLQGRGVEVVVEAGRVPAVAGEPAALREVLMNLVLNALDALPQGGRVTIRTWAASDRVHVAVADTGTGMSDVVRQQALEPFFTTKGPKSTGLGLSVAYGTIERHGGTLVIDSEEGHGTRVTVTLPAAGRGAAVAVAPPTVLATAPLRVLVIDDEPDVRATLVDMLEAQGHTVVQAPGGREGLGLMETGPPVDLVLTDLGMPGMTGWDVARQIRERWPVVPVGLMTGWGEQQLTPVERSRVSFVITKPFDLDALSLALAEIRPRLQSGHEAA